MKRSYQKKKLKYVLIVLELKKWDFDLELERWMNCVEDAGMKCILKDAAKLYLHPEKQNDSSNEKMILSVLEYHSDDALVLTNNRELSGIASKGGYVCIGLDPFMETFFDGADAVVSSIMDLDPIYMEELFLRAKGIPVVIAETERIRIREIAKEDIPALYEISRQDGMEYAFSDQEQAECFECSRMEAYISNVYRFYGYGLWTVETLQGDIVGCCGLSDMDSDMDEADKVENEACIVMHMLKHVYACEKCREDSREDGTENRGSGPVLEMQYFVANRFQKQGFGSEMCRAVIRYARERLSDYALCVRVHPKNKASVKLAEKLGFQYCER